MTARIERNLVRAESDSGRERRAPAYLERYRAPFSLRCGALLIDYIVPASVVASGTLASQFFGNGSRATSVTVEGIGFLIAIAIALFDLILLAGWRGQTLGKWATGLRIERKDGTPVGFGRAALRHLAGYALSLATFGLGFVLAAFNSQGRALHDLIAGTVVVRDGAAGEARGARLPR